MLRTRANYVADTLNELGLYAMALDVRAERRSPEQGIEHIWQTIERGNRTADWKQLATRRVEDLEDLA